MGKVVAFRQDARRRAASAPPEGSAQILFFLGVRYCRSEDDKGGEPRRRAGAGNAPRTRRKKRA